MLSTAAPVSSASVPPENVFTSAAMKRSEFGLKGLVGCIASSLALVCLSSPAYAGDARRHDGFYLRLGAGLGYAVDSIKSDTVAFGVAPFVVTGKVEGTATGFAGASELAAGYSLADGFVLGGGLYSVWIPSPKADNVTVTAAGFQATGDVEFDASSFHLFGPFVDYYFDPQEGLHFQGGLGYAWLSAGDSHYRATALGVSTDTSVPSTGGGGFGLMAGFGDEWWVSDSFSLGVLGRLTMGFMSGERNGVTWNHTAFAPAVLFTATMN
jgi:hypothetical protein